jgi:predicted nucleotidyltransferase component of viral defense system
MDPDERDSVAAQFGVSAEQVERDHLISHLLGFFSREFGDRIHFIGGTALARTHLPYGRLSEDIDLIAVGSRKDVAHDLNLALPRALARTHGRLTAEPTLGATADTRPVMLRPVSGLAVRLQLLSARDRIVWPTERRSLFQRYTDAPAAELLVPTLSAFAASKTATWADRHAARDLWDLWALSRLGAIDATAVALFRRYGPTNQPPAPHAFRRAPSDTEWRTQLAGQTQLTVSAKEAFDTVRETWEQAVRAARTLTNGE